MGTPAISEAPRVDQFLMATEARFDRWRTLLQEARTWDRSTNQQNSTEGGYRAALTEHFNELRQWEDYFAYPGQKLLDSLEERIRSGDAAGAARLIRSTGNALLTNSYRANVADWESEEQAAINLGERVPGGSEGAAAERPYFEVLVVSPARRTAWQELAQDSRKVAQTAGQFCV